MNAQAPVIDSHAGFVAAVRWGFASAIESGARRIVCVDPDFGAWPLDEAATLQALAGWLRLPLRRLVLLAGRYDEVPRRCPRFTAWRAAWAHAIETWQAPAELAAGLPTLFLADSAVCVQLVDAAHWRGRAERDERVARLRREETDAVLQRSEAAFAVNTLGL